MKKEDLIKKLSILCSDEVSENLLKKGLYLSLHTVSHISKVSIKISSFDLDLSELTFVIFDISVSEITYVLSPEQVEESNEFVDKLLTDLTGETNSVEGTLFISLDEFIEKMSS